VNNLEENVLNLSGLQIGKEISVFDVKIDYLGENFLHTIKCGNPEGERLVLYHGFGGSSVMFYKILKALAKDYLIYCVDMLGMGLSSRPSFQCTSTEETIKFFTESLEAWRVAMKMDKFVMGGHSFGGYMACHYAVRFSSHVSKLILLSPLGFTKANTEYNLIESGGDGLGFFQRQIHGLKYNFFKEKKTLSSLVDKYNWILSYFVRKNVARRFKMDKSHADILYDFLLHTYRLPDSAQRALHYVINPNIVAYDPLEDYVDHLEQEKIPVIVLYGDGDWMNCAGAKRVAKKKKSGFKLDFIKEAGHQLMMENAEELAGKIIQFCQEEVAF